MIEHYHGLSEYERADTLHVETQLLVLESKRTAEKIKQDRDTAEIEKKQKEAEEKAKREEAKRQSVNRR